MRVPVAPACAVIGVLDFDIPIGVLWHVLVSICSSLIMVFPVVMYGCESWTVKKAETKELMLLNSGVGEDS